VQWNAELSIADGAVGADPRAFPGSVDPGHLFHLPALGRPLGGREQRVILGLDAPTIDTVQFSLWACDSRDLEADPADRRWYLVLLLDKFLWLAGGSVVQTRLDQLYQAFSADHVSGLYYFCPINAAFSAAERTVLFRAVGGTHGMES